MNIGGWLVLSVYDTFAVVDTAYMKHVPKFIEQKMRSVNPRCSIMWTCGCMCIKSRYSTRTMCHSGNITFERALPANF